MAKPRISRKQRETSDKWCYVYPIGHRGGILRKREIVTDEMMIDFGRVVTLNEARKEIPRLEKDLSRDAGYPVEIMVIFNAYYRDIGYFPRP